jgi:hypothetical protein
METAGPFCSCMVATGMGEQPRHFQLRFVSICVAVSFITLIQHAIVQIHRVYFLKTRTEQS